MVRLEALLIKAPVRTTTCQHQIQFDEKLKHFVVQLLHILQNVSDIVMIPSKTIFLSRLE